MANTWQEFFAQHDGHYVTDSEHVQVDGPSPYSKAAQDRFTIEEAYQFFIDRYEAAGGGGGGASLIPSVPTPTNYPVTNLFVDASTGMMQVEYNDAGGSSATIETNPTTGNHPVTNLYVQSGKLVVEYND